MLCEIANSKEKGLVIPEEGEEDEGIYKIESRKQGGLNFGGHKRGIIMDKIGKVSWTLFVYSSGHFVHENSSFWVILVDIFG